MENLFLARDEIIDVVDDVEDYWEGDLMKCSVLDRLSNALNLLDDLRKELGIPDRAHDSVAPDQI